LTDLESEYDLFVSYSRADNEFARRLVDRIESETYNGRRLRCFFAEWDILPGENIVLKLERGLRGSRYVAIVMSPDWERSDWATLERVIPVYQDPAGYKARLIPILRKSCIIPPSIMILKWLNFSNDANFEREARRLVARITNATLARKEIASQPLKSRSRPAIDSSSPDFQDEILASNLFPTLSLPFYIYSGRATVSRRNEVWDRLGEFADVPPFAFQENICRIWTFAPLANSDNHLSEIMENDSLEKFSASDTLGNSTWTIIDLLNRAMTAHMKSIGMVYDWSNKKTFYPLEEGQTIRYGVWKVGNREFKRTLVRKSGTEPSYFAHRSCKATFMNFNQGLYLRLLPGWHFTEDGIGNPVPQHLMGSLSSRWMNRERNHSVLDDVRFWIYALAKGAERLRIDLGGEQFAEVSSSPLFASTERGIEGDYRERLWYEESPEVELASVGEEIQSD